MKDIYLSSESDLRDFLRVQVSKNLIKETDDPVDPAASSYLEALNNEPYNLNEEEEEVEEEEVEEPKPTSSDFTASLDSFIRYANDLRSGESLKDADIRNQVQDYYDRLSLEEQEILVIFFREISEILTGKIQGVDAEDPSDSPEQYQVTKGEDEKASDKKTVDVSATAEVEPEKDLEDDTPPIKVNEAQDMSIVKKKFQQLIKA